MNVYRCRFCLRELKHTFIDLGLTPLANSYVTLENADEGESFYPLHVRVCENCLLVQLPEVVKAENIFSDYLYFSSFSDTWLAHARAYCDAVTSRFGLDDKSLVIEVASNDGYLLQFFKQRNVGVLGIEPAGNVAEAAKAKGVPTRVDFFGEKTANAVAAEGKHADLMVANNVLAHVPDINDFVKGFRVLLSPTGVATFEFPHLLNLIRNNQFDTIYHEHYSYLALSTAEKIFAAHGLSVFDVEHLPTHGGSLRVFVQRSDTAPHEVTDRVRETRALETDHGMTRIATLTHFGENAKRAKRDLLSALIEIKRDGKKIAAYGAAAKGNTLLNYCGIKTDFIDFVCDANPNKQGLLLPGTRIQIVSPDVIRETKPDYILILPWNITDEVVAKNEYIRDWGGQFVVAIPEVRFI